MSLIHNGTLIIMKNFNENLWYSLSKKYKVSFSLLVSVHIKRIIKNKLNLKKLKYLKNLVSVSDVLEDSIRKKILQNNFYFHEIYGTAEISTVANIKHNKNSKSKSVGKILNFAKVKIINDEGKKLKDGKVGEIICNTPLMFNGYENKKKLTKQSFVKNYFKTGDIGYIKNNFLFFLGRKNNILKVSGLNVYPEDIETVIGKLSFVKEVCVKGEYDDQTGESIVAYIIAKKEKKG